MKLLERPLRALGNRRRLAIIAYVKRHPGASVSTVAHEIRLSFKATSRHLGILVAAGILEREQRGLFARYGIVPSPAPVVRRVLPLL